MPACAASVEKVLVAGLELGPEEGEEEGGGKAEAMEKRVMNCRPWRP